MEWKFLVADKLENAPTARRLDRVVDFTLLVLAEREYLDATILDSQVADHRSFFMVILESPDLAGYVVGIEVGPLQFRKSTSTVDVAAGNRLADTVVVFPDRLGQFPAAVSNAVVEVVAGFPDAPSIVGPSLEQVDFFPEILADIPDPDISGRTVDRDSPGIADPVSINFRKHSLLAEKWIVDGDGVILAS